MFNFNMYGFVSSQSYAESLCRSFCDLLKDITNEGQVQVLKVLTLPTSRTYIQFYCLCLSFISSWCSSLNWPPSFPSQCWFDLSVWPSAE